MKIVFFMAMIPPTATHQEKKVNFKTKTFYEPTQLKNARRKLEANLSKHVPPQRIEGPIKLLVQWCFPITGKHLNGEYKTSKPDTDNLNKLLKDCMTVVGFWIDDAQVVFEVIKKSYNNIPGIYVEVQTL